MDDHSAKEEKENDPKATMTLRHWPRVATRLLKEGGSSAWNVQDDVLSDDSCDGLCLEIQEAHLMEKLKPARTKGESDMQQLLSTLLSTPTQKNSATTTALESLSTPANSSKTNNIRGDKSIFLSREYRNRPEFAQQHPFLHELITRITTTVSNQLQDTVQFHLPLTSVQLAVYPGDGFSGYPRHCDRGGDSCREEGHNILTTTAQSSASQQQQGPPQRIITAVYYLTDRDWKEREDGGCLRVFGHSRNDDHDQLLFHDIIPYRNRMIVFRSDGVEHQVLPSLRRDRIAITVWMYGRLFSPAIDPTNDNTTNWTKIDKADNKNAETKERTTTAPLLKDETTNEEGPPPLQVPTMQDDKDESLHSDQHPPTIFVSIASYRDSETAHTIQSLFSTANHPNRIFVGLVLQLDDADPHDAAIWQQIQQLPIQYKQQVRILRLDARHSTGPCNARAQCQTLFRGEDFVLQIDSHMRFRGHWDDYLIDCWKHGTTNPSTSILTAYPVGYQLPNRIPKDETRGTLLVPWKFDESGILRQRGRLLKRQQDDEEDSQEQSTSGDKPKGKRKMCIPCHLYAAGFNFGPSSIVIDKVPYDPHLHQLFFGEEMSMAVRFFTHGYDLVAPPETVVYHLWSRSHRPTQSPPKEDLAKTQQRQASLQIVQNQLRGISHNGLYGLGTTRTVAEYGRALQVEFEKKVLWEGCEHGCLKATDFCDSTTENLYPVDSMESKIAGLDSNAKDLIAFFLGQASS